VSVCAYVCARARMSIEFAILNFSLQFV
jgi:hypothetical protein